MEKEIIIKDVQHLARKLFTKEVARDALLN